MTNENINLTWALYYQRLGLPIFPVIGKTPLVKWGEFQERVASENEIRQWWEKFPNADIGMVTGPITKTFVLDIDGEAGANSVKDLPIPSTRTVRTRKGFQYHFRWSASLAKKTTLTNVLGDKDHPSGVDTRGDGGYCKMPPSKCADGTFYGFLPGKAIGEIELAEAPAWLVQAVERKNVKNSYERDDRDPERVAHDGENDSGAPGNWIEELMDGVGIGDRHEAFTKLAGYYFNIMHPDVAAQHLREWNSRNTPPMEDMEEKIADMTRRFKNGEYDSKFLSQKPEAEVKDPTLISASDVVKTFNQRPEFLVNNLVPIANTLIFGGWQGLGKTYIAGDLVIEISRKKGSGLWLGKFGVKRGPVLWIDNEMGGNPTSYRLRQLLGPKGLIPEDLDLYYYIREHFKFTKEKHYSRLKADIERIKPVLVVVDSFASSCAPLDENASKDMRYYFDDLLAPICDEFKCTIMVVDHESKGTPGIKLRGGKRLRGSGAKGDCADVILSLDYQDGCVLFEHSKPRHTKRLDPFGIEIVDVAPNGIVVREMQRETV